MTMRTVSLTLPEDVLRDMYRTYLDCKYCLDASILFTKEVEMVADAEADSVVMSELCVGCRHRVYREAAGRCEALGFEE